MGSKAIDRLYEGLEKTAVEHGCEILLIEATGSSKSPLVRIYLDAPGGIGLDELSEAQQWIDPIVDDIDPYPGAYTLEVSSPGIDRPLRTRAHFERWAGEQVVVKASEPHASGKPGTRTYKGELEGMRGDSVVVCADGAETEIAFDAIVKAHVVGQIDFHDSTEGKDDENGF